MGNASSSKPGDFTSGILADPAQPSLCKLVSSFDTACLESGKVDPADYVGFEIRQAGDRGIFKKDPRKYTVQLEVIQNSDRCSVLLEKVSHIDGFFLACTLSIQNLALLCA